MANGKSIRIEGTVQGVGFRPAVWQLAVELGLSGTVCNDGGAVAIRIWGEPEALAAFSARLPGRMPPLAGITRIECADLHPVAECNGFHIIASRTGGKCLAITADLAICGDCLSELTDSSDRRYGYAFGNCTRCGPRFSIIRDIPYDRENTSMAAFPLCPVCRSEYLDPGNRRFHAQAIACPDCGPGLWLEDGDGQVLATEQAITLATTLLGRGHILAVKGLGGFNLICDAKNQHAVSRLRQRKHRFSKPFAIMARDADMLADYARLDDQARQLLAGAAAPIVLLDKQGSELAAGVAPNHVTLGCVLPYTPLHHLLLQKLPAPIVFTSANRGDEPQVTDNAEARRVLAGVADFWLMHDRDIVSRVDDSVLHVADGQPRLLRRSRGYAPLPIRLPEGFDSAPPTLAMGADLKNTFCQLQHGQAVLSPHAGDLHDARVLGEYRRMQALFQRLFRFHPEQIAVDLHPGYQSTELGREWAMRQGLPLSVVQHHHAHLAACMAEHGLPLDTRPVLGVAMDGLGMGEDGTYWGGEFLQVDYRQYRRLAMFEPLPMPGGNQAVRQPWRNCYAHLQRYFDWPALRRTFAGLDIVQFLDRQPLPLLDGMLAGKLNSPLSSACGRVLDAFAAALGVCRQSINYEGQAACELEALATPVFQTQRFFAYPHERLPGDGGLPCLGWRPFWQALFADMLAGETPAVIAARIHHGLAAAIADTACELADEMGCQVVVLGGGVFQNRLLLAEIGGRLRDAGKIPLSPAAIPCHDGGLALGQAVIAAARLAGRV